jgi:hypothetical protein
MKLKRVRLIADVPRRREAVWLAVSAVAATAFCWFFNEYGFGPVPFFTLGFYLVSGVVRLMIYLLK